MESTAPLEGPAARGIRRIGLLLFLLAALLPYHGCRAHPGEFEEPPVANSDYSRSNKGRSGASFAEGVLRKEVLGQRGLGDEDLLFASDGASDDMGGTGVFMALPFWAAALWLVRGRRPRTRWGVGAFLWLALGTLFAAAATAGFRQAPDLSDPPWFGDAETTLVLSFCGALLLIRPRNRWGIGDIEAAVSSQALLGIGLCLIGPTQRAWRWIAKDGHSVLPVARALWINYRIGFWLALAALALIAAPLFLSEESLGRFRDRLRRTPPPACP